MENIWAIGLLTFAFVFMKFIPNWMLQTLHHPVIMFITLVILLWFTRQSKLLGVLALLWIGALYLERNRHTLHIAHLNDVRSISGDPTMPKSKLQIERPFERPMENRYAYEPQDEGCADQNEWSAVAPTIDHKRPPLETVPLGEKTGVYLMSRSGGWWKSMFGMFD